MITLRYRKAPRVFDVMMGLERYLHDSSVEQPLIHLIKLRVSQMNGCAYRIDMHWKDLTALGRRSAAPVLVACEAPFYTDRDRAALGWAEALTQVWTPMFQTSCTRRAAGTRSFLRSSPGA